MKSKKKAEQLQIPAYKKMVEELYNPDKDNQTKQYQVKEDEEQHIQDSEQ
jgi:hypothetical protein